jgi:hypothetical protein
MKKFHLPRPATVIACLALVFALGGTAAYAANTVRSADIVDGEVYSRDIHNRSVKGQDVLQNSLGSMVIRDNSLTDDDLADGSVGPAELQGIAVVNVNSVATSDADGMTNGGQHGVAKATATCPEDSVLLSGGAHWVNNSGNGTNDGAVYLQDSYRSGAFGESWTAEGVVDFGAQGTIQLQVSAYCLTGGVLS